MKTLGLELTTLFQFFDIACGPTKGMSGKILLYTQKHYYGVVLHELIYTWRDRTRGNVVAQERGSWGGYTAAIRGTNTVKRSISITTSYKTQFVLCLIDNIEATVEPLPKSVVYYFMVGRVRLGMRRLLSLILISHTSS